MLQLAGHLRGRARQEWSLLGAEAKTSYDTAVKALRLRLDPGSRTLAAQEFRHTTQGDTERVADFIRWLEHTFNIAYGREGMSVETRDTLLHGQLQDALKHDLMRAPAVSGAQTYQELCLAARNEEKRLAELKKRQQYMKPTTQPRLQQQQQQPRRSTEANSTSRPAASAPTSGSSASSQPRKCFLCSEPGHITCNCPKKSSGHGRGDSRRSQNSSNKQIISSNDGTEQKRFESLQQQLDSSSEAVKVRRCVW